jgi:hypothetical protein
MAATFILTGAFLYKHLLQMPEAAPGWRLVQRSVLDPPDLEQDRLEAAYLLASGCLGQADDRSETEVRTWPFQFITVDR